MGYTHFSKIVGAEGSYVGAVGSEVEIANSSGQLRQSGVAVTATAAQLNKSALLESSDRAAKVVRVALAAADTGGGVLAWANPESSSILVQRVIFDVTTKSTGACTLDVGATATNATTSADNLMDGIDVGTAAGVFDNVENQGTNGTSVQKLASGKWITASKASGAAAGLVGYAYIEYVVI
ncbi:MAG: hypothetical protein Q8873_00550 [Bacillota bacterium]|nr:hypothetical protein [Bacillota bacterium]